DRGDRGRCPVARRRWLVVHAPAVWCCQCRSGADVECAGFRGLPSWGEFAIATQSQCTTADESSSTSESGGAYQHGGPSQFGPESFERRAGSRIGRDSTQFTTHIESGKRRQGCDDIGFSSTGCGATEEAQPRNSSTGHTQGHAKPAYTRRRRG